MSWIPSVDLKRLTCAVAGHQPTQRPGGLYEVGGTVWFSDGRREEIPTRQEWHPEGPRYCARCGETL